MRSIIVLLLAPAVVLAEQTLVINSQGRLLDADDQPFEGTSRLTFSFFANPSHVAGEQTLWTESYDVPVHGGLYSVDLGNPDKTLLPAAIFSLTVPLYLEVAVGTDIMSPRLPVGSVPVAATALRALDLDCEGCVTRDMLAPGSVDATRIKEGAVTSAKLAADIDGGKLALASVPASALAGGIGDTLLASGIDGMKLKSTSVPAGALAGGIGDTLLLSGIDGMKLKAASVPEGALAGSIPIGKVVGLTNLTTPCTPGKLVAGFDADLKLQCVTPQLPALLQWTTAKLEFGTLTTTPVDRTSTLTNVGRTAASGLLVAALGGYSVKTTDCDPSLGAGETCSATVTLSASAGPGVKTGTLFAFSTVGGSPGVLLNGTVVPWPPPSCKAIELADSTATSKLYTIYPSGAGFPLQAYCEMDLDDGGWTMVYKNLFSGDEGGPTPAQTSGAYGTAGNASDHGLNAQLLFQQIGGTEMLLTETIGSNVRWIRFNSLDSTSFNHLWNVDQDSSSWSITSMNGNTYTRGNGYHGHDAGVNQFGSSPGNTGVIFEYNKLTPSLDANHYWHIWPAADGVYAKNDGVGGDRWGAILVR